MSKVNRWLIPFLKLYSAVALAVIAVLSPPAFAAVPVALAAVSLFLWWKPFNVRFNLIIDYFVFFAVAILIAQAIGLFYALLSGLPVLALVALDLEMVAEVTRYKETRRIRDITPIGLVLILVAVTSLVVSVLLGNVALLLSSIAATLFFVLLIALAVRGIPARPVIESVIEDRIVAGTKSTLYPELINKTKLGRLLLLHSLDEWVKLKPEVLSLKEQQLTLELSFIPALSGPTTIKLGACVIDRWGLTQTRFELEPVLIHVIPRARYATWLAKRYLAETKAGALPLIANVGIVRPLYGLRTGIEYYGSQMYQPGDSLKNIDWKHSIKYNKLISKEFAESRGQPAILLVNLAVADAEERDKQTYNFIVAALSLAREQIPTTIAAYDDKEVNQVTASLQPVALVSRALEITNQMKIVETPVKYLDKADISRLHSNLRRLRNAESKAAGVLTRLLEIEYANLKVIAQENPAFKALSLAFGKSGEQSTVVVVSPLNHDAEAVMFSKVSGEAKNNPVLIM